MKEKIKEILIQKGQDLFSQPYKRIEFTKNLGEKVDWLI